MEQPLVSVVVISYNQGKYIKKNLDSLKAQTYINWELIVCDDESQDNSVPVFENWLKINEVTAKRIFHAKNTGVSTVLNEAIELCKGKYVKMIAADDYLHPDCLAESVNCLEKKGLEYGMVFTDTFCIDDQNNAIPDIGEYNALGNIPPKEFQKLLLKSNRIAALTVLMRLDVVKETGQYNSKFLVEDYYRWLKINEKYLIAYIPKKLSYYRLHGENISIVKAERILEETKIIQMMFDPTGILKDKINEYIYGKYFNKKEIPKDLLESYKSYPFHIKRLKLCVQYNIPPFMYTFISKFL